MRNVPYRRLLQIYVRKRYRTTPALLTVGVELMTFLWALSPIRDWDSQIYHLPSAEFMMEHSGLAVSWDRPLFNLPGPAYLWYALGLMAGQDNFAALMPARLLRFFANRAWIICS